MTTRKRPQQKAPDGFRFTVGDKAYEVYPDDLTGEDAGAFRRATGHRLVEMFGGFNHDLDTIGGLIWLVRRKDEPSLSYAEVAASLSYADYPRTEVVTEEEPSGEAPAAT